MRLNPRWSDALRVARPNMVMAVIGLLLGFVVGLAGVSEARAATAIDQFETFVSLIYLTL